jgi:hypothetical protein
MHYASKDGKYKVDVADNGVIKVKHGDWLSKYSAAIYDNYWNIHVFARKDRSGKLVPVANPNLIHSGETIYHLPTFDAYVKSKPRVQIATFKQPMVIVGHRPPGPPVKEIDFDEPTEIVGRRVAPMGEEEKKKFILEHLRGEYDLRGEHWEFVEELTHILHMSGDGVEILEIVAEFLPKGLAEALPHVLVGVLEGVADYCPIIAALAFPVHATIKLVNAWEFGQRLTGLRAVAYGITAWAFDEAVPSPPPYIRANISPGSLQGPRQATSDYARQAFAREEDEVQANLKAWRDACQAAYKSMDEEVEKKGGDPDDLKTVFVLLGDGDRNTLARRLMTVMAERYLQRGSDRDAFWSPDPNYPN